MPIPQRPRTPRYLVAKWDDIHHALDAREIHTLISMLTKISQNRTARNLASTRQYVVVSDKNRQMYDEVWGMVLAEIEESQEANEQQAREVLRRFQERLNAFQLQQQATVDPDSGYYTDEAEEAEDEDFALESSPSLDTGRRTATRPSVSLTEAEQSLQSAWTATNRTRGFRENEIQVVGSSSPSRNLPYAQRWQPAAVWVNESDDREPANIAAYDLETYG